MSLKPPASPNVSLGSGRVFYNAQTDFGAYGNGTRDDTSALTTAVTQSRANGIPLFIPAGSYLVTSHLASLSSTAALKVFGAGPGLTTLLHQIPGAEMFGAVGTYGSTVAITSGAAIGGTTLQITSTTGLAKGDMLTVRDTTQIIYGNSGRTQAGVAGQVVRVRSVDSATQLTLYGRLEFAYTTSGDIRKWTPVDGVSISDLTIQNPTPGTMASASRGLSLTKCRNVRISNVEFRDMDDDAMRFQEVVDFVVDKVAWRDIRDIEVNPQTPYSLSCVNACSNGLVSNSWQRYGRHMFTAGGGTSTEPQPAFINVSDCVATEMSATCFDTHPGTRFVTFSDCKAHGTMDNAFQIRGPDTSLVGCVASGATIGAYVTYGADRCVIRGNRFSKCDTGIRVQSSDDCHIVSNRIDDPITTGIYVSRDATYAANMSKLTIVDNDINGTPSSAGINFTTWLNTWRVENNRIPDAATTSLGRSATTVASAAGNIVLPRTSDTFSVTGTAAITSITADMSQHGRTVRLVFASTATLTDGSNLKLNGNLTGAANTAISLVCDGTNWVELSRSAN